MTEPAKYHLIEMQEIRLDDPFSDNDLILDLGGGGEGAMGRLRGRQVVALDRRAEELAEAPEGPIKVIGDATALPFLDEAFDAVTAFYFLMYVPQETRPAVFEEAFRVLKSGGCMHLWGLIVPPRNGRTEPIYVIQLDVQLPNDQFTTGYGTRWDGYEQTPEDVVALAEAAGFVVEASVSTEHTFEILLRKPT